MGKTNVYERVGGSYRIFLILIVGLLLFTSFALAIHVVKTSAGGTTYNINEDVGFVYNITVNNTDDGQNGNITQLNITLPSSFLFISGAVNGATVNASFSNTTSMLIWSNSTPFLINGTVNNTFFWFNATASTPGQYNITVATINSTGAYYANITINVNDTTAPSNISFWGQTPNSGSNLSQTSIPINLSATDNAGVSTIRIYLFNSTGAVNQTNGTGASVFVNFTSLVDGTYYVNATVNDTSGNANSTGSETRVITLDTVIPTMNSTASVSATASSSATVSFTASEAVNYSLEYGNSVSLGDELTNNATYSTSFSKSLVSLSANTTYYFNITMCDYAKNCRTNGTFSFTTSLSSSDDDDSGSSGTSNTYTTYWTSTYSNTDKDLSEREVNRVLGERQRVNIKINNVTHYVGVIRLTSTQATINVSSTPQQAVFSVGDSKKFELSNDTYYDLKVVLNTINGTKANVTISYLHEQVPTSPPSNQNLTGNRSNQNQNASGLNNTLVDDAEASGGNGNIWLWIIISLLTRIADFH